MSFSNRFQAGSLFLVGALFLACGTSDPGGDNGSGGSTGSGGSGGSAFYHMPGDTSDTLNFTYLTKNLQITAGVVASAAVPVGRAP
jgi:hypothetical protein